MRSWPAHYRGPYRLLDIGTHGGSLWRLRINDGNLGEFQYATLSHCWGRADLMTLNQSTIGSMMAGLPVQCLPATFRDVIMVAHRIGLRYLWIDCLCIMQDCVEEWTKVSSEMHDIYMFSACTFACTAAKSPDEGCFYERNAPMIGGWTVIPKWSALPAGSEFLVVTDDYVGKQIFDAPLNRRAWVVQEMVLSARIIHFAKDQLFWECCSQMACETYPKQLPPRMGSVQQHLRESFQKILEINRTKTQTGTSSERASTCQSKMTVADVYYLWLSISRHYTSCDLTKPEDKLVAISAIAKKLSKVLEGDTYLAGLWKDDLVNQLLWRVSPGSPSGDPKPFRATRYRAPSWSWASGDGEVWYSDNRGSDTNNTDAQCLEADTTPLTTDPTGQIVSGYIRLRAQFISCLPPLDLSNWTRPFMNVCCRTDMDDGYPSKATLGSRYLLLRCGISRDNYERLEGLVVSETATASDTYRRVGYWVVDSHDPALGPSWPEGMPRTCLEPGHLSQIWDREKSPYQIITLI
jgi:Heterokaryon incompatibility protein (HET)